MEEPTTVTLCSACASRDVNSKPLPHLNLTIKTTSGSRDMLDREVLEENCSYFHAA